MLKAKEHFCEEAAILPPGFEAYIPCNNAATKLVGWPDRGEGPLRMCEMCADHNIRNRGAKLLGAYHPASIRDNTDN